MSLRNSAIINCDATMCVFANGDELSYADDCLNLSGSVFDGFVLSIDWYDAQSDNTYCGYEMLQSFDGNIYPLQWFEINDEQTYNVTNYDYDDSKCLATLPMHPSDIEFWHCIYDAIQKYDKI